ncbi:hypothetical protein F4781DRAFT_268867 [Annulohypoxylon bovei var. microspora]|nr:hypothetical protein F4781DRAFT_268867 [Annulohypoxylon bovei var. microspora]
MGRTEMKVFDPLFLYTKINWPEFLRGSELGKENSHGQESATLRRNRTFKVPSRQTPAHLPPYEKMPHHHHRRASLARLHTNPARPCQLIPRPNNLDTSYPHSLCRPCTYLHNTYFLHFPTQPLASPGILIILFVLPIADRSVGNLDSCMPWDPR